MGSCLRGNDGKGFSLTLVNSSALGRVLAADLHRQYGLATADAVVYATARRQGAELLTYDAHFKGLPGVALFAKSG